MVGIVHRVGPASPGTEAGAPAMVRHERLPARPVGVTVPAPRASGARLRPSVPAPSLAAGPWAPDWSQAEYGARIALQSIDWSKRDIVIWVPGTSAVGVHDAFAAAVQAAYAASGTATLLAVPYPADWNMRTSMATGIATLKLILQGIAAHGGSHRVLLAGESQGAWIIGETMADPQLSHVVDRAVLFGHPGLAAHHYPAAGTTAAAGSRVLEINNPGDHVAMPVNGDPTTALDAMQAIYTKDFGRIGTIASAVVANPAQALRLAVSGIRAILPKGWIVNPHDYAAHMSMAVEYLRTGREPYNA